MRRAPCSAPRKRRCSPARLMPPRAWAAPVSGVWAAWCAPFAACAWLQSPRASYKGVRFSSEFRIAHFYAHRTGLPVFPRRLCLSPLICLCFCSVSARLSSLPRLRLVSASALPLFLLLHRLVSSRPLRSSASARFSLASLPRLRLSLIASDHNTLII